MSDDANRHFEEGFALGTGRMVVPTRLPPSDDEGNTFQPPSKVDLKAHEAKTARTLTLVLVSMLGASFIIHEGLVVLMSFYNKADAITTLEHTFNQWLPGLTGLVGTAVGFYLKERK
jgi:hypothetical protein